MHPWKPTVWLDGNYYVKCYQRFQYIIQEDQGYPDELKSCAHGNLLYG